MVRAELNVFYRIGYFVRKAFALLDSLYLLFFLDKKK
jgi:hypothetical protein